MDPNSSERSAQTWVSGDHSIIKATKETEIFRADEWTGYVFCGMVFLIIMTTWFIGFLMGRCSKRHTACCDKRNHERDQDEGGESVLFASRTQSAHDKKLQIIGSFERA